MTRKLLPIALLLAAAPLLAKEKAAPRAEHPDQLRFGELEFEMPETTRHVLDNGLVVHLLENHELPLVTVTAWVRAGAKYDPPGKTGLSTLTGAVMRAGGTTSHPADALDEALDRLAAIVTTSIEAEHAECRLDVLSKNLDAGLGLFAELLREPAFPEPVLATYRQQLLGAWRMRHDDPGAIADRLFDRTIYGGHPYARQPDPETLGAITRQDLVDLHARCFVPGNVILGVSGDFRSKELLGKLGELLGDWERTEGTLPAVPSVDPAARPGVFLTERDLTQSTIRIGQLGVRRNSVERVEADLMNVILGGGGFGSRLTGAIRVRGGLAYSIYSRFTRAEDLGTFVVATETKSASTWRAVSIILDEIRRIRDEPVTAEELRTAKDLILNGFVFGFEDPADVVDSAVSLEYYGYPEDWLDRYLEVVRSMTVERIREVARARLDPERLSIVIVGKSVDLGERPEGIPEIEVVPLD
jgi:predicted Zn-dependent peptidase